MQEWQHPLESGVESRKHCTDLSGVNQMPAAVHGLPVAADALADPPEAAAAALAACRSIFVNNAFFSRTTWQVL